ncbi:MAG: carboxypeptidase-like regulatory domain-containing protein [Planctomycetaceae bacterium]|jgi:hypothetical protein|nr:carboxypeptidase-like regulatory domain-containing protein [Planctomycetaceae bacterium]
MMNRFMLRICFVVPFLILTGCNNGDPRSKLLVPAAGVVLYNGTPLAEASIVLFNKDAPMKQGGSAITAANGTFTISMYGNRDGTYSGNYAVTISKTEVKSSLSNEELLDYERRNVPIPEKNYQTISTLPEKYSAVSTTDIRLTIPSKGDKNIKIELTDN